MNDLSLTTLDGGQTMIDAPAIEAFAAQLRGSVLLPTDPAYDATRAVWNGMIDRRPGLIVSCRGAADVVAAVRFARDHGLLMAVRGGGHHIAGNSVCDGGVMIDLSLMKSVRVDASAKRAWVEPGALLADVDRETQAFGLVVPSGINSTTGIAGLTLGGGFGKLGRRFGLACDNLLAADVVTADGRLIRASSTENSELFWGLRGGGGNFGVVTAFEYRLHPVGPDVLVGSFVYAEAQARDALRAYHAFSRTAPDEVSADAALVTAPSGERLFSISVCYSGPLEAGERAIVPLRSLCRPTEEKIAPVPYLQVQSAGDAVFPRGRRYYWKAQFLREITDAAIDALVEAYAAAPSVTALAVLQHVGGAIARVPATDTAYAARDAAYDCFPIAIWDDPADDAANMTWAREMWTAMRPFSTGAVYVNNLGDEGEDRIRAAYGPNYARLVALKNKYDPENIFRLNQNIRPKRGNES
ncbi:FAD-binding oxidoreductase [Rhizobiaceae sp. 2RAB30]